MIAPLVHMNGTSREELLDQLMTAVHALYLAVDALQKAAPNQRDYYPLGQAKWQQAQADHRARLQAVTQVRKQMIDIAAAIEPEEEERQG